MVFQNGMWKFLSLKIGHFWAKSAEKQAFSQKIFIFHNSKGHNQKLHVILP